MSNKPHTVYKLKDGKRVPGVTTLIGVLNKPALVKWANNLGLQGIDSTSYVDNLAQTGTLAHEMILAYLKKEEVDTSEYTGSQVEMAQNSFASYLGWARHYTVEPILVETPMVSEQHRYGGTPDLLANVDGVSTLLDFKTGKALYPEHNIQVAAYRQMIIEQDFAVDEVKILRIGREESEGFEVKPVLALDANWELFLHCKAIYELQRDMKKYEQTEKDIKELW